LRQGGIRRKEDCREDAPKESFWTALETELVYHRRNATREEAKREIAEYNESIYNRQRKQARLCLLVAGYLHAALL